MGTRTLVVADWKRHVENATGKSAELGSRTMTGSTMSPMGGCTHLPFRTPRKKVVPQRGRWFVSPLLSKAGYESAVKTLGTSRAGDFVQSPTSRDTSVAESSTPPPPHDTRDLRPGAAEADRGRWGMLRRGFASELEGRTEDAVDLDRRA